MPTLARKKFRIVRADVGIGPYSASTEQFGKSEFAFLFYHAGAGLTRAACFAIMLAKSNSSSGQGVIPDRR